MALEAAEPPSPPTMLRDAVVPDWPPPSSPCLFLRLLYLSTSITRSATKATPAMPPMTPPMTRFCWGVRLSVAGSGSGSAVGLGRGPPTAVLAMPPPPPPPPSFCVDCVALDSPEVKDGVDDQLAELVVGDVVVVVVVVVKDEEEEEE